jgi:hypothetical protein
VCWDCKLMKVTRHEAWQHWTEWYAPDGTRIHSKLTPPCQPI